jgi:hypothetical protein
MDRQQSASLFPAIHQRCGALPQGVRLVFELRRRLLPLERLTLIKGDFP